MYNQRPEPGEYSAYFDRYLSLVGDEPILDVLQQLKEDTCTFFSELDVVKGDYAYAEGKWTIKEVIGHLIDAERTFAYRAMAFARGQKELPGFDENAYVENADFNSRFLKDLATEYCQVREANMYLFRSFSSKDLNSKGISNGNTISVRTLLYLVAGHEIHHMNIIKERYL
jgi:uncharacterized damage-inducible protein DinB